MSSLDGDNPCAECGATDNIGWFTEDVLWNNVVRSDGKEPFPNYNYAETRWGGEPILCIRCFITVVEERGLRPTGWRLLPEWPWRHTTND